MPYADEPMAVSLPRFPHPVNEISARLVAAGVVVETGLALALGPPWWLAAAIAYGFVARVAAGPALGPLGLLVTRQITPRLGLEPRYVPGPPKRFAQGIGAVLSSGALLALALGAHTLAVVLIALILCAATLESAFALCIGCRVFAVLMRIGWIPPDVCADCADIWRRAAPDAPG